MIMVTVDELYSNPPSIEDAIAVRIANVISNRIREVHFIKKGKSAEILLSDFYLEENVNAVDVSLNLGDLEKIENILKKYPNIGPRYSQRENNFVKK